MTLRRECVKVKLCLVGEMGVGKTSIERRLNKRPFSDEIHSPTVGGEGDAFNLKYLGSHYQFSIWDTAGSEKYRTFIASFFRGARGALVVYDITSRRTFEQVDFWIQHFKEKEPRAELFTVCGNKSDLEDEREVSESEGRELAERFNASFFETSAKTEANLLSVLYDLVRRIHDQPSANPPENQNEIGPSQMTVHFHGTDATVMLGPNRPTRISQPKRDKKKESCC